MPIPKPVYSELYASNSSAWLTMILSSSPPSSSTQAVLQIRIISPEPVLRIRDPVLFLPLKNLDSRSGINISNNISCQLSVTNPDFGSGMENSSSGIRTGINSPDLQHSESPSCSRLSCLSYRYLPVIHKSYVAFDSLFLFLHLHF
jgi:hypothetical protein